VNILWGNECLWRKLVTTAAVRGLILALLLGACASDDHSTSLAKGDARGVETCEPSIVFESLSEQMKISFQGSRPEGISRLYDAFFVEMRKCNKDQDLEFSAKQEWAPSLFDWLSPFPELPPFRYFLRVSSKHGLCLSRIGLGSGGNRKLEWFCEIGGWTNNFENRIE
jgi:hypothetical protein